MSLPDFVELQHDDRRVVLRLVLPADAQAFQGHFPDMPVLPGVFQIAWAMRLAHRYFHLAAPVADDFRVKFSRIIQPGVALILTLELDSARQRLSFEYRVDDQIMSSGRVRLETVP